MRSATKKHTGKDPAYLEWIRTLPCTCCQLPGYLMQSSITEAAHTGPHGLSTKSADGTAIPLCAKHHREGPTSLHRLGKLFWDVHGLDRLKLLAHLNVTYELGRESVLDARGSDRCSMNETRVIQQDDRGLPPDFEGCLPRAYDRRAQPRPEILDRHGYEQKLAADLQAMRVRARMT